MGFSIEPLGDGRAVGWLDAGPRHANPMGTVHGGILCDVADAAMGMAFVTTLRPDESVTGAPERNRPAPLVTPMQPIDVAGAEFRSSEPRNLLRESHGVAWRSENASATS